MKLFRYGLLSLLLVVFLAACGGGGGGSGGGGAVTSPAPSATDSGAAYVYAPDAAGALAQQAYVKASNANSGDFFGEGVALSGDTLVVKVRLEDSAATGIDGDQSDNSANGAGAVYVFTLDGAGVWSQQAYIKAVQHRRRR